MWGRGEQDAGDWDLRRKTRKPPVGCRWDFGRSLSHPLHQQSHPTLVVAGVSILRHASAHKRSPLFRRRAPATNTVDPKGLRAPPLRGAGKPFGATSNEGINQPNDAVCRGKRLPLARQHDHRGASCRFRRRGHARDASRGCEAVPPAAGSAATGRRVLLQEPLGFDCRFRGADRLERPVLRLVASMASVPLQSG